jgi:hypothetical protein
MSEHFTVTKLATLKDKLGKSVEVKSCNQTSIGPPELMAFFYSSLAELIDLGHGSPWPGYTSKSMAVYIEINDVIVGLIMFNYNADQRQAFIVLSAVNKEYRNRGLYKLMHYEFEKASKKLGAKQITSLVHVDNAGRLASAKTVDFVPQFYKMIKDL